MCQVGLHKHSLVISNSSDLRDMGQGCMWQGGRAGHKVGLRTHAGVKKGPVSSSLQRVAFLGAAPTLRTRPSFLVCDSGLHYVVQT